MPRFLRSIADRIERKETLPVNRYEGFKENGAVIIRDRRGTSKAEIPQVSEKSSPMGDDPMAIYKPTGAKNVDAAKAMGNFTGWTYAAVHAIAREISGIQFRLYRVSGKDHEEVDEHELLDLLDAVNVGMTGIELKYVTTCHLELTGNAYWFLDGVSSDTAVPRAIHPLNPGRMRVKLDKSSFPYRISHYEYTYDAKVYRFEPYQILHIKYPDPGDPFVGIGVPQAIPVWIDSDNYALEYNRKYFQNGAQIGLFIQTESNVEGNLDRIRKGFANRHEGTENAHKVPVLPKGVELKHTGVTHKDMDFSNLQEVTRDRILAAFGVSKTILGTAESDTNRATADTADYVFSKRTVKPKVSLIISYLNEFLVPRYGDDLYLTFVDPTPEDKQALMDEMAKAVGTMPVMTQNEARQTYLGLGPIEGGDQLMTPAGMVPAGTTSKLEGEDVTPQLVKTVEGWDAKAIRVRTGGKTAHSVAAKARRQLTEAFAKRIGSAPQFQVKSITELTKSEYMEHYKRFSARSEHAREQLHKVFEHINREQLSEVLDNLPDATGVKKGRHKGAVGELFDLKEWIGATIDLATPILRTLAKDEATAALAMIGAQHQDILADKETSKALDKGIAKMAKSYNETTLQQLKEKLAEELTKPEGTSLNQLKDVVEDVYSFADERRAGLIAKTESYRAANWANREAWQQSGVVKTLVWFTSEDEKVCPQCDELDGKEVGFEDKFFNDTYSDGEAPPAHPDCRCYVRPGEVSLDE